MARLSDTASSHLDKRFRQRDLSRHLRESYHASLQSTDYADYLCNLWMDFGLLDGLCSAPSAGEAKHSELHEAAAETHCFARCRRPDVDSAATNHAASVCDNILATVSTGLKSDARTQRQKTRIRGDDAFRNHLPARGSTTQTVGGRDVRRWRNDVSFFRCDPFPDIAIRGKLDGNGRGRFDGRFSCDLLGLGRLRERERLCGESTGRNQRAGQKRSSD